MELDELWVTDNAITNSAVSRLCSRPGWSMRQCDERPRYWLLEHADVNEPVGGFNRSGEVFKTGWEFPMARVDEHDILDGMDEALTAMRDGRRPAPPVRRPDLSPKKPRMKKGKDSIAAFPAMVPRRPPWENG